MIASEGMDEALRKAWKRIDAGDRCCRSLLQIPSCLEVGKPVEAIKDEVRFQGELQAETEARFQGKKGSWEC